MAANTNIIKVYASADAPAKVEILFKNYSNFLGIVDSRTEGLLYLIENEKSFNHKASHGDLGVRVQSTGHYSDPTGNAATDNVITREAIIQCDFSNGVLDGVDREQEFIREASILRNMRRDYQLLNKQFQILPEEDRRFLCAYLRGECEVPDIADELGVNCSAIHKKVSRLKIKMKETVLPILDGKL